MYKIGLTGGMGCGKSEVCRLLQECGFPTIDADSLSKEIAAKDVRAIRLIKKEFGAEVYSDSGELQRQILAKKVFGNQQALKKLNAILHPLVFEYVDYEMKKLTAAKQTVVIIEAALFYETGWDKEMDAMIVVTAPMVKRLQWLQKRDGATQEQIKARMKHQIPVEEKAKKANFVVDNCGTIQDLRNRVKKTAQWIEEKFK